MAGASAGAAAAAIANAIKASGAIVQVDPTGFVGILARQTDPVFIYSPPKWWSSGHKYLTSYKGFIFQTSAAALITLPGHAELIQADSIWVPG